MTPQEIDVLVKKLEWAAARSKVSADNANYFAPVTIAEAEQAATALRLLSQERATARELLTRLKGSMKSDIDNGYPPCQADIDDIDAFLGEPHE